MFREYQHREDIPLLQEMAIGDEQDASEPLLGNTHEQDDHDGDFVTANEREDLARGLHQRHIGLIALAGAVVCFSSSHAFTSRLPSFPNFKKGTNDWLRKGTGLFLGLGGSIQTGGPLGALLGYATVGLIVCAVQFALGEVTALLPVTGSFVRHAEFLVDPALGFAIG
jgi:amino acid transporter